MKAEYIHKGKNLDYINPTDETITAGTVIILGEICAVAAAAINPGEVGAVTTVGVWKMPKDNSEINAGTKVYYDAEKDVVTSAETATERAIVIGVAVEDAAADAGAVSVRLNG